MTPLAAKVFRNGDEEVQRELAGCQFFECTSIVTMAIEMIAADVAAGDSDYSDMAQLPSPVTVIEFIRGELRMMAVCKQEDDLITYRLMAAWGAAGELIYEAGFRLGTAENFGSEWNAESGFRLTVPADKTQEEARIDHVRQSNSLIQKMLCMINQPGLIERRAKDSDKRVVRMASERQLDAPVKWHECRVRPGVHGNGISSTDDTSKRQLHYVRKHFKPSLNRWIDGHWRGNADLGIHLKWYSLQGQ